MMRGRLVMLAGALTLLAVACGSKAPVRSPSTGGRASATALPTMTATAPGYHPVIDPAMFSAAVTNPWFPLKPGSTYVYEGVKDGKASRDVYTVTPDVKVVMGVPCVVVDDRLYLAGHLEEKTSDYYSQDRQGDVWYFGEATEELDEHGRVTSTEGSWLAGEHGAEPGIYIQGEPVVGQGFRQEFYRGHAEDQFQVLSLAAPISVPYGSFRNALLTKEWTVLEPNVLDHKYYVKGIGEVAELSVKGPVEQGRLVSYSSG